MRRRGRRKRVRPQQGGDDYCIIRTSEKRKQPAEKEIVMSREGWRRVAVRYMVKSSQPCLRGNERNNMLPVTVDDTHDVIGFSDC